MKTSSSFRTQAGFTLTEVCMALGIVSFAFVSLVGLLPAGMNMFRHSMDASIGSQIMQRVVNEAQQTDFETLVGGVSPPPVHELFPLRYFDDEGNEILTGDTSKSIYHVHAVVKSSTVLPGQTAPQLATVVVQVAVNPGQMTLSKNGGTMLWTSNVRAPVQNYTVLVAHR